MSPSNYYFDRVVDGLTSSLALKEDDTGLGKFRAWGEFIKKKAKGILVG